MMPLFVAIFFASIAGSTHCAGMCGAFLAFAVASESVTARTRALLHAAYNGGRLVTYSMLGALAGALGHAIDLGGSAAGVQRAAMIGAGTLMVGFGAVAALRAAGVRIPRAPLPHALTRLVTAGHRAVGDWPPVARAGAIGLLTTLLPCGWLYAFAITAAGTGDWKLGAATMAAFWLGTLPVMLSLGAGLQAITGPLRRRLPLVTSLIMLAMGLWTIAGRAVMPKFSRASGAPVQETALMQVPVPGEVPCCHE